MATALLRNVFGACQILSIAPSSFGGTFSVEASLKFLRIVADRC